MNLKLLFFCLFLAVLLLPAELKRKKHKDRHLHRHHHHHHHHHHHGGGPLKQKRQRFQDIINDFFFQIFKVNDDDDDDEDDDSNWLYEIQEPEGPCDPNPCLHNGVCKQKGGRQFKCDCPKPYKGKKCEKGPKRCKKGACGRGECVVTSDPPYFECKCKEPFQPPSCTTFSVCEPNPCVNGGECIRDGNDFDCRCPEGFTGRFCHVGPNDCCEENGRSYRGNVSETEDGDECLHWNSHFVLPVQINPFHSSEDENGLGPHNFCRNPDGDQMPWCFLRRGKKLFWNYCDVAACSEPTDSTEIESPDPTVPTPRPTIASKPMTTRPPKTQKPSNIPQLPPTSIPTAPGPPRPFSTCGRAQPRRTVARIYGGLKVASGAIPWQVSVQVRPKNTNQAYTHVCGGVLIDSCWVLTAGHCIEPGKDMQVMMGGLSLHAEEPSTQTFSVGEAIRHEAYRETPSSIHNDIALLKLSDTDGVCAHETQFVKAACLPDAPLPDGIECTISGWGATENSEFGSTNLLQANVLLINQGKCSESKVYGRALDNTMFCAGHLQGGIDSCQGDSGGPLTCNQNNVKVVYGLVSWGDQCGRKNKPGVYTRVLNFVDWIRSKTQASSP
ncbi:hyaluronan-binding protein 2-like [Antennarius striatus]|uniref:hyaluronan-binding protein 2-like n=1 Tax=Antennarius striatus TaxID=241820 RepID=UPI0035AE746C